MDFEKILELENILSEHKKNAIAEKKAEEFTLRLVPQLRSVASQLYAIASALDGTKRKWIKPVVDNTTPFRKYLKLLVEALQNIKSNNGLTIKDLAGDMGVSEACMYDFLQRGPLKKRTRAVGVAEVYVARHGYDLELMKSQAEFK